MEVGGLGVVEDPLVILMKPTLLIATTYILSLHLTTKM
jgi:hypothetical protein